MSILTIKVIITAFMGALVGGTAVRGAFRTNRKDSFFNVKNNLCSTSKRKFRVIELVPILGTTLSNIKYSEERYHLAKVALIIEIIFSVVYPVIILMMDSIFVQVALVMSITLFTYGTVGVLDNGEMEKEELKENKIVKYKSRFQSRNTGI